MSRSRSIPDGQRRVIQAMAARGLSDAEIAAEYGVTSQAVHGFRLRHGIGRPPARKLVLVEPPPLREASGPPPRPRQIGERYDENYRHLVRIIEPRHAMGDLELDDDADGRFEEVPG